MEKKSEYKFEKENTKKGPLSAKWNGLAMAIFWAFLMALIISNVISPFLSNVVTGFLGGIIPILIGILFAFIFHKLVNFIERVPLKNAFKHSTHRFGLKRFISVSIVTLIIIGIIVLIFSIIIPKIVSIIVELTDQSGSGWTEISRRIAGEISDLVYNWFHIVVEQESIIDALNSLFSTIGETISQINSFLSISINVFSGIFNFMIGLLLAILMLKDKDKIAKFSKRFTYTHFKKEKADEICIMTRNSGKIVFDYIVCKFIEFAILFVSTGLAFSIMGLKFTWEAALLIGIFNFIPYFGCFIGAGFSVILTLIFQSLNACLYMSLATIIITTILGNTIIPFITGSKLKVSALVVISSILIGGGMFGMIGMFIAPPIAAIISSVIMSNIELKENHMQYIMELDKLNKANKEQNIKIPLSKQSQTKKRSQSAKQLTLNDVNNGEAGQEENKSIAKKENKENKENKEKANAQKSKEEKIENKTKNKK